MTGPKTNEGELLLDDTQVSTKATAKYLKGSASKARAVLDLIRGLDVRRADEVLRFSDRGAAADVRKVLASAVANAVHNFEQDVEELFVVACYADEGPTLKRFRPRARGSASRIRKRSCHVTVVVARMSDARLEVVQARQAASTAGGRRAAGSAQSRRDRVARSRARAEALRTGGVAAAVEHLEESEANAEILEVLEGDDATATDDEVVDDGSEVVDGTVVEEAPEAEVDEVADDATAEVDESAELADDTEAPTASAPDRSDDDTETGVARASEQPDASEASQQNEEDQK
jgi:large subunit ribosomal protein L22